MIAWLPLEGTPSLLLEFAPPPLQVALLLLLVGAGFAAAHRRGSGLWCPPDGQKFQRYICLEWLVEANHEQIHLVPLGEPSAPAYGSEKLLNVLIHRTGLLHNLDGAKQLGQRICFLLCSSRIRLACPSLRSKQLCPTYLSAWIGFHLECWWIGSREVRELAVDNAWDRRSQCLARDARIGTLAKTSQCETVEGKALSSEGWSAMVSGMKGGEG